MRNSSVTSGMRLLSLMARRGSSIESREDPIFKRGREATPPRSKVAVLLGACIDNRALGIGNIIQNISAILVMVT